MTVAHPACSATTLTKQVMFVASHYYWVEDWSDETNHERFRGCANRLGHGHNYVVEVTVQGPVDPNTGFIINFFEMDPILQQALIEPLDHKLLNAQVPFFTKHLPTLENVAQWCWQSVHDQFIQVSRSELALSRIRVYETNRLWVDYDGAMTELTRQYTFSAAHQLWNPAFSDEQNVATFGACSRLHGHNYTLEVSVSGEMDPVTGMIVDLVALDAAVEKGVLQWVDHRHLDEDVPFLSGQLSTVENVATVFVAELQKHVPPSVQLTNVRLAESSNNWVDIGMKR